MTLESSNIAVINICTGSLALALPVPVLINAKLIGKLSKVVLINRPKKDTDEKFLFYESLLINQKYLLKYRINPIDPNRKNKELVSKNNHFQPIEGFDFIYSNLEENISLNSLVKEVIQNNHLVITVSPKGENARFYVKEKLLQILPGADKKKFIFIISCENGYRVSSSIYKNDTHLKKLLEDFPNVYFLDCVVDRLASDKWRWYRTDDKDFVQIDSEQFYNWTIEKPIWNKQDKIEGENILKSVFSSEKNCIDGVHLIENGRYDIEYYKKTICINGLHYAIALLQEYLCICKKEDQEFLNHVLNSDNYLNCFVMAIIEELKKAAVNMIKHFDNDFDAWVSKKKEAETSINAYMDRFVERMKLLDDKRGRILDPLVRISLGSHDIWGKISSSPSDYFEKNYTEDPKSNDLRMFLDDYMKFFKRNVLLPFDNFLNLHDFEDKLLNRIGMPINFIRFEKPDCFLLKKDIEPTANLHLERVAVITNYVIKEECSKLKQISDEKLGER